MEPTADGDGGPGRRDDQSPDGDGPSFVERAVTAASVLVAVAVFSFVVWQAVTTPARGPPRAEVVDTSPLGNGSVEATVAVVNPSAGGLEAVTVRVHCDEPPVAVSAEHVPVDDRRTVTVVCPAGSRPIRADVVSWIEA